MQIKKLYKTTAEMTFDLEFSQPKSEKNLMCSSLRRVRPDPLVNLSPHRRPARDAVAECRCVRARGALAADAVVRRGRAVTAGGIFHPGTLI